MATKVVGIVGAGVSGLLACKYVLEAGHCPRVFDADADLGGVWTRTIESTKLQSSSKMYRFSDHPWPETTPPDMFPKAAAVLEYLRSYAHTFDLLRHIQFNSRVVGIDYEAPSTEEELQLWGGTGDAFGKGRWHLHVQHTDGDPSSPSVYTVDFVILCIGRFSGLPRTPSFPPGEGPEVFNGKVLHSMDYSNMDNSAAAEFVKGRSITVVGFSKSAVDIAAECSLLNGTAKPCTLLFRRSLWIIPPVFTALGILYLSRLAELFFHKPGEGLILYVVAMLLSPLRWLISKLYESYIKCIAPIQKFGMVPKHSFFEDVSATKLQVLPDRFYDRVEEGSIVLKKSPSFGFYENGVVLADGETVKSDVVILATGFDGRRKLGEMFRCPKIRTMVMGPSSSIAPPLYRECIHPRVPQLAVVGYSESLFNLYTFEMRCMWLSYFLRGRFQLPTVGKMERDVVQWERYMKQYCRGISSVGGVHSWYVDHLCNDMGIRPAKKKGFFRHWLEPSMPEDYGSTCSSRI